LRAPALVLAGGLAAGLASGFGAAPSSSLLASAVTLIAAAIVSRRGARLPASAFLLLAYFLLGRAAQAVVRARVEHEPLALAYRALDEAERERPCLLEGRLRSEPRQQPGAYALEVSVERLVVGQTSQPALGGARVQVPHTESAARLREFTAGDRIRLWARLRAARGFLNPGRFEVEEHLARLQVSVVGSTKSALLIDRMAQAPLWSPERLASRGRAFVRDRIQKALGWAQRPSAGEGGSREDETAGVLLAMLVGDRSLIPAWTERLYQEAGTFHVIAISGAHVALLALMLYGTLRKVGLLERPSLAVVAVAIPAYAVLCGATASVARAALMALTAITARALSLDSAPANALAVSALVLLAVRPLDLGDPGFQLSFLATATIIGFTRPIAARLRIGSRRLGHWVAVSLAAQAGVFPVLAWHFQRATPAAVPANLLAVPASAALLVVGGALVAFQPVPGLGRLLSYAAYLLVKLLTWSSLAATSIPGGSFRISPPGPAWMTAYLAALALALLATRSWRRVGAALLVLLSTLLMVWPERAAPDEITLSAIDVGHGDALLLEIPGGERVLVDGGGSHDPAVDLGEAVVVPFLLHQGIRTLSAVVLTHPDRDHIGGLGAVVSNLRVSEIWAGPPAWELDSYRELRRRAAERGVSFRRLREGEEIALGRAAVEVLAAGTAHPEGKDRRGRGGNTQSLVLRVRYGEAAILLTGDAEQELERRLVRSRLPLGADILKVGHHGSRSSTTPLFLGAVAPRLALISTGRSGAFRLPSPRVIHRLRERGVVTYRTDRDGSVVIALSGARRIRVRSFTDPRWREIR